jgi:hypothetical protein
MDNPKILSDTPGKKSLRFRGSGFGEKMISLKFSGSLLKKKETLKSKGKTRKKAGDSEILSHDFGEKKESLKFQGKAFEKKRNP